MILHIYYNTLNTLMYLLAYKDVLIPPGIFFMI